MATTRSNLTDSSSPTGRELRSRPVSRCRLIAAGLLALSASLTATAQRDTEPSKPPDGKWREDPYTKNESKALAKAGYVKYAPIPWAADYTSLRIEQALGDVKIRWVETAHFRLGCDLGSAKLPDDRKARKRLKEELKRLRSKLPTISKRPKRLDPWLRTHLFAQRLEELYAEISKLLGVTDKSFPSEKGELVGGQFMGRGPFFGSKNKFNVLLLTKESDCGRYLKTFTGSDGSGPSRWYFELPDDTFVFATAAQYSDDAFTDDTAMHCHVVFNMVHNMMDAYRGYRFRSTVWWQEGLAHVMRREISKKHNSFSEITNRSERIYTVEDWERRTLGHIKHEIAKPLSEVGTRFDFSKLDLNDHMAHYSRIEFLRTLGDKKLATFIHELKGCGGPTVFAVPQAEQLQTQLAAIKKAWGFDSYDALDEAWKAWAKKAYRGKK